MDQHAELRALPLVLVIPWLGISGPWKERKGATEWSGKCPLHQAKTNAGSFSFHADGRFHCFSCQAKGRGAIDFVIAFKKISFQAAVEELKGFNGAAIQVPQPKLTLRQEGVQQLPTENQPFAATYDKFAVESAWLKARGLTKETLERYEVFEYNNPKRKSAYSGSVMLQIRRYSDGEPVGYLSRNVWEITPENPKYVFPKGFHKGLEVFGAFQLKEKAPHRMVFLVESPFAVMAFSQRGFAAVSPFGFSVSAEQAGILSHLAKGIIYLPDRDKFDSIAQTVSILTKHCWVKTPALPSGVSDPEQLQPEQIRALMT